jgi:hypothetical protein
MGFEPTTPTLAIFGFMCQRSYFCGVSMRNDAERIENMLPLRGQYADTLRTLADCFGGFTQVVRVMVPINVT